MRDGDRVSAGGELAGGGGGAGALFGAIATGNRGLDLRRDSTEWGAGPGGLGHVADLFGRELYDFYLWL